MTTNRRRAVVIGGVRTPFVKAFSELMRLDTIALGTAAVRGLLERYPVPRREIGALIWGGVILPAHAPNVGREIVLDLSREGRLDPEIEALTVTRACASGLQAVTLDAGAIERGDADLVIAGGSDSTSNAEVKLPQKLVHAAAPFVFGKPTASDVLGALGKLWPPGELLPRAPKVAERSTGQVMGEAAEDMARRNQIARGAQDEFAVRSHQRAATAIAAGRFAREVAPVAVHDNGARAGGNGSPAGQSTVHADTLVRATTSVEKLARLPPAFAKDGTVTAGSSSPLTDGAAAVLLASEERAAALGLTPLARVTHWSYVGVDPGDQLLLGPALAMPRCLARAGLRLDEIDLVYMHEAFAAQVLATLKAFEDPDYCMKRLGRSGVLGSIDRAKMNVKGSSLAYGHPFAATGARIIANLAKLLAEHGGRGLISVCTAGGMGVAAIMESAKAAEMRMAA